MVKINATFVLSAAMVSSVACLPQKQADTAADTSSSDAETWKAPYPEIKMSSGNAATAKAAAELVGLNQPFDPFPVQIDYVLDMAEMFGQNIDALGTCAKDVEHGCVKGKYCQLGEKGCVELPEETKRITTEVFLGSMFRAGELLSLTGKCSPGSQHCLSSGFCQIKATTTGKVDPDCGAISKEDKVSLLQDLISQIYEHDFDAVGQANYGFRTDEEVRSSMAVLIDGFGKCTLYDTPDCQRYNMCAVSETKGCVPFNKSEKQLCEESAVQAIRMARTMGVCEAGVAGCGTDGFCQLGDKTGATCSIPHPARQSFLVQTIFSELIGDSLYGQPDASVPQNQAGSKHVETNEAADTKKPVAEHADTNEESGKKPVTEKIDPTEPEVRKSA